jgi:hypothetical protein
VFCFWDPYVPVPCRRILNESHVNFRHRDFLRGCRDRPFGRRKEGASLWSSWLLWLLRRRCGSGSGPRAQLLWLPRSPAPLRRLPCASPSLLWRSVLWPGPVLGCCSGCRWRDPAGPERSDCSRGSAAVEDLVEVFQATARAGLSQRGPERLNELSNDALYHCHQLRKVTAFKAGSRTRSGFFCFPAVLTCEPRRSWPLLVL